MELYQTINYYFNKHNFINQIDIAYNYGIKGIRCNICKFNENNISSALDDILDCYKKYCGKLELYLDLPYPRNKARVLKYNFEGYVYKNKTYIISFDVELELKNKDIIFISKNVRFNNIYENEIVYYADGIGAFKITKVYNNYIEVVALSSFKVKSTKSINIGLLDDDNEKNILADIVCKISNENMPINYLLSFVEESNDIIQFKKYINSQSKVIAKIETEVAIENINEIVKESDGIVFARGDLAVEVGYEYLYIFFDKVMHECIKYNKKIYCATDILFSLQGNYLPSRADIMDVSHMFSKGCENIILNCDTLNNLEHIICILNCIYRSIIDWKGETND